MVRENVFFYVNASGRSRTCINIGLETCEKRVNNCSTVELRSRESPNEGLDLLGSCVLIAPWCWLGAGIISSALGHILVITWILNAGVVLIGV